MIWKVLSFSVKWSSPVWDPTSTATADFGFFPPCGGKGGEKRDGTEKGGSMGEKKKGEANSLFWACYYNKRSSAMLPPHSIVFFLRSPLKARKSM